MVLITSCYFFITCHPIRILEKLCFKNAFNLYVDLTQIEIIKNPISLIYLSVSKIAIHDVTNVVKPPKPIRKKIKTVIPPNISSL